LPSFQISAAFHFKENQSWSFPANFLSFFAAKKFISTIKRRRCEDKLGFADDDDVDDVDGINDGIGDNNGTSASPTTTTTATTT